MSGIPFPELTRVYVQNLAGDVLTVNGVTVSTTTAELKKRIHTLQEYDVGRQCLFISRIGDLEGKNPIVLQNHLTFGQHGIFTNETLIYLLINELAPGEHIMSFDLAKMFVPYTADKYCQGICASVDELFLSTADSVQVFHTDGTYKRNFEHTNVIFRGIGVWNDELFIADSFSRSVKVYSTDGLYKRNIGRNEYMGVCVSRELFVSNLDDNRVDVYALDGTYLRSIGDGRLHFPNGLCVKDDTLYVIDYHTRNNRVQVFRASDGRYLRCIGEGVLPHHPVDVSISGNMLYVSCTNHRVQVFHAETDLHLGTIAMGIPRHNGRISVCVLDDKLYVADCDHLKLFQGLNKND